MLEIRWTAYRVPKRGSSRHPRSQPRVPGGIASTDWEKRRGGVDQGLEIAITEDLPFRKRYTICREQEERTRNQGAKMSRTQKNGRRKIGLLKNLRAWGNRGSSLQKF